MCKAQETRKKLAHLGTANRYVWGMCREVEQEDR